MVRINTFKGLIPKTDLAEEISSLPYDVFSSEESRVRVKENPLSFLRIDRPEINFPETDNIYQDEFYKKAKDLLDTLIEKEQMVEDQEPYLYLYKLAMDKQEQIGLVATLEAEDYENSIIKKHELTREEKEKDRIKHVSELSAHTGPIFLTYQSQEEIDVLVDDWIKNNEAFISFTGEDGVSHYLWRIDDKEIIGKMIGSFQKVPNLYIADGHHRAKAGVEVAEQMKAKNPRHTGDEEYNRFLGVLFPHKQLNIMDYNRVVKDLNGLSKEDFLSKLEESFEVEKSTEAVRPMKKSDFGMFLDNQWYLLTYKGPEEKDLDKNLDVSILQDKILRPLLGIEDPRLSDRIDFVGGIRGLEALEKRCDEDMALAFSLYPTSIEDLMSIADQGKIMPPKSTWFEPKLRSGLFIHRF